MLTERQKKIIERLKMNESDFQPSSSDTTIEDVVEALNVLTDLVIGTEEE